MNKAKKFLIGLLAFASVSAFAFGVAACGDDSASDNTSPVEKTEIERVYDSYVEYAAAQGQAPLDYETWLATIKGATGAQGDKGDKGETGEQGVGIKTVYIENGHLFVILTEGDPIDCGPLPTDESNGSSNLSYIINEDGLGYTVTGIGLCSDRDVVIPNTYKGKPVTAIGDNAFNAEQSAGAGLITSITIPDSVTTIGEWAFADCDGLTSVTIPDSVTAIASCTFYACTNLTSITLPDSVTTIESSAFCWSGLTSITIPNSMTTIGGGAFWGCSDLTSVTIPDSVTAIGEDAFYSCGLISITLSDSVTTIGSSAFFDCDNLTSITFTGTVAEWDVIEKGSSWNYNVPATKVVCSDGEVEL